MKSVELPGGLKVELQEIRDEVAQTRGTAESARNQAEVAVLQSNHRQINPVGFAAAAATGSEGLPAWQESARLLVAEYATSRNKLKPGAARTQVMSEIVSRMMTVAKENPGWSVGSGLQNADRSWRLFAYVCLYVRPDFALFPQLVLSAVKWADGNKNFEQYWSLLALQRVLSVRRDAPVGEAEREMLSSLDWKIEDGTDRDAEMQRVLAVVRDAPAK